MLKDDHGYQRGLAGTKGSLATFMNKALGKKASGKTGMRKTVFESKDDESKYANRHAPRSIQEYKTGSSRQQVKAANALGSIFMKGAKDKITGKILLPSVVRKGKKAKSKAVKKSAPSPNVAPSAPKVDKKDASETDAKAKEANEEGGAGSVENGKGSQDNGNGAGDKGEDAEEGECVEEAGEEEGQGEQQQGDKSDDE